MDARIGRYPDDDYVDMFVGLATPAMVGRSVLGPTRYEAFFGSDPQIAVLFVSRGDFNPRGVGYLNASSGYRLDRLRLIQGDLELTFVKDDFERVSGRTTSISDARDAGVLFLPENSGFDPLQPWRLEFLAHGTDSMGEPMTLVMPVGGGPSSAFVLMPESEPPPAWVEAWTEARSDLIIVGSALTVLTLVLAFQHLFTRYRRLYRWLRNGFLLFTVVWLGWIAGGQLSTLHLLNYAFAPLKDFGWAFYLAEPLIRGAGDLHDHLTPRSWSWRILRLAMPVWGVAGASRQGRLVLSSAALEPFRSVSEQGMDRQICHRRRAGDCRDRLAGGRTAGG